MRPTFAIFAQTDSLQIAKCEGGSCQLVSISRPDEEANTDVPVSAIAAALAQLGYRGEGILLGLPSAWCLCAAVDDTGLRRASLDATLRFRLEEQLPLTMEEMVADFVPGAGRVLGIAVPISRVESLVQGLENSGIAVVSICPIALLVAQAVCDQQKQHDADALLCDLDNGIDLLQLYQGRVVLWTTLPSDSASIETHIRHITSDRGALLRLGLVGVDPKIGGALRAVSNISVLPDIPGNSLELAAVATEKILCDGTAPPIELRRGKLATPDPLRQVRTPLRVAVAGAIVFLLSLAISMLWRASQYDRLSKAASDRQANAFHEVLPHQVPPALITSRLASEAKRLRGLSGVASSLPPSLSILPLLRDTLMGLPPDMRLKLLELRFEPQRLYIEGQTLNHSDADQITAALRASTGLNVDPPHTEQPPGEDVTFTLTASAGTPTLAADKTELNQ